MDVGIAWCNKKFVLEREMAELSFEECAFTWVETVTASDSMKFTKAIQYAENEKKYLYTFLEHPDAPIDNNRVENAIRLFCVGRKNWLFSTSQRGAEASAIIYSVAATACANGLNI